MKYDLLIKEINKIEGIIDYYENPCLISFHGDNHCIFVIMKLNSDFFEKEFIAKLKVLFYKSMKGNYYNLLYITSEDDDPCLEYESFTKMTYNTIDNYIPNDFKERARYFLNNLILDYKNEYILINSINMYKYGITTFKDMKLIYNYFKKQKIFEAGSTLLSNHTMKCKLTKRYIIDNDNSTINSSALEFLIKFLSNAKTKTIFTYFLFLLLLCSPLVNLKVSPLIIITFIIILLIIIVQKIYIKSKDKINSIINMTASIITIIGGILWLIGNFNEIMKFLKDLIQL